MTVAQLDCDLLSEFRNGDGCALHEFVDKNFATITNYVSKAVMRGHLEDAEEAANTAFHLAAEQLKDRQADDPLSFVGKIAHQEAVNIIRRRERQKRKPARMFTIDEETEQTVEKEHGPTARLRESVNDALEVLNDEERTVIQSCYYESRSLRETAQVTGYSFSKVRDLHDSAKAKLRGELADEFA